MTTREASEASRSDETPMDVRSIYVECNQAVDILASLYAAWHKLPPCPLLGVIGGAIQEIQALRPSVSDEHPEGRDLGLGAKPASAVGSEADETPEDCFSSARHNTDCLSEIGASDTQAETPHPHPHTDKGVESLIEDLGNIRGWLIVAADEETNGPKRYWLEQAATALERLTRERDEALVRAKAAEWGLSQWRCAAAVVSQYSECTPVDLTGWTPVELSQAIHRIGARAEASEAREASLKAALEREKQSSDMWAQEARAAQAEIASLKAALEEIKRAGTMAQVAKILRALTTKENSDETRS